jgi:general stress protein 26
MANEEQLDRVWEIIERVGVCMLTTRFAGGLRARPLEARPDRDDGRIWFVTDLHSGKEREIESEDDVGLVFGLVDAHSEHHAYNLQSLADRSVVEWAVGYDCPF